MHCWRDKGVLHGVESALETLSPDRWEEVSRRAKVIRATSAMCIGVDLFLDLDFAGVTSRRYATI